MTRSLFLFGAALAATGAFGRADEVNLLPPSATAPAVPAPSPASAPKPFFSFPGFLSAKPARPSGGLPPPPRPSDPAPVAATAPVSTPPPLAAHSPAPSPIAPPGTPPGNLDFAFLDRVLASSASPSSLAPVLRAKMDTVAIQSRGRDIFNDTPSGPLLTHAGSSSNSKATAQAIDPFLQSIQGLRVEMVSTGSGMIVADGQSIYLGDLVSLQTGAFVVKARLKEVRADAVVFENPETGHAASIPLPGDDGTFRPATETRQESLDSIAGISRR